ncbi:hypothetical protein JNB11_08640 [Kocuria palustris]|nr:hypothetical protein [Kocuria palustris]
MANTIRPDPELERFNFYKQKLGDFFRFRPKSSWFNVVFWGVVPVGLALYAYDKEGLFSWAGHKRQAKVLPNVDYTPREKDL